MEHPGLLCWVLAGSVVHLQEQGRVSVGFSPLAAEVSALPSRALSGLSLSFWRHRSSYLQCRLKLWKENKSTAVARRHKQCSQRE